MYKIYYNFCFLFANLIIIKNSPPRWFQAILWLFTARHMASWVWSLQLGLLESLQRGKVKTTSKKNGYEFVQRQREMGFQKLMQMCSKGRGWLIQGEVG
jgi:hypothetical protein